MTTAKEPCLAIAEYFINAEVHVKAIFWLGIKVLMRISRLRFKQSRMLITHIYVLGSFVNFTVTFRYTWK